MTFTRFQANSATRRLAIRPSKTAFSIESIRVGQSVGFTLLELLVVIGIMALIGSLVAPSLKRMQTVDLMGAANRQLLDDLAEARRAAIVNRTTVFMVFMPPVDPLTDLTSRLSAEDRTRILANQQTAYAMYVQRSAGDQPGRDYPRYLGNWRTLPEGVFIPAWKFTNRGAITNLATESNMLHTDGVPNDDDILFPSVDGVRNLFIPYIAFDYLGSLISDRQDEIIPLARGYVTPSRLADGTLAWQAANATEDPPNNSIDNFNHISIDWLTGKAHVERPTIP